MVKISKEAALAYHESGRPGKIEVKPTKAYRTQTDLSLAYSPGVAYPCLEIQDDCCSRYMVVSTYLILRWPRKTQKSSARQWNV